MRKLTASVNLPEESNVPSSMESTEYQKRIQRSFGLLAFIVNRHLIDHMRRLALKLDMDFEATYLYGTLAHLNVLQVVSPTADPRAVLTEQGFAKAEPVPVRLADVVQVSGLPRETVRRKLEALQSRGKVTRTPEGLWCYDQQGIDEDIVQFTLETIERFLKTADEMRAVIDKAK
jgi:hypothetical protein